MLKHLLLLLSVFTLSQAGNIIRLCHAPPPVVAFYRLIFALVLLSPILLYRLKKKGLPYSCSDLFQMLVMGVFFAFHFFTWIEAIQHTTVANAAILFSVAPIFTAMGARMFYGERVNFGVSVAMMAGVLGVLFTGIGDLSFESKYLYGDFMGILAAIFFALYFLMGKKIQQKAEFFITMPFVFFSAALTSLIAIYFKEMPLTGFDLSTWYALFALGLFPTIIGHGLLIYSLRFFKSSTVSTLTLVEPVLAAMGAWAFYSEAPLWYAFIGYGIMAAGLSFMFNQSRQKNVLQPSSPNQSEI